METATNFPVNPGTEVEVKCIDSDAVNEGSSKVTCSVGTVFSFLTEPSCSKSGLICLTA